MPFKLTPSALVLIAVLLIILKTAIDLISHNKEHKEDTPLIF